MSRLLSRPTADIARRTRAVAHVCIFPGRFSEQSLGEPSGSRVVVAWPLSQGALCTCVRFRSGVAASELCVSSGRVRQGVGPGPSHGERDPSPQAEPLHVAPRCHLEVGQARHEHVGGAARGEGRAVAGPLASVGGARQAMRAMAAATSIPFVLRARSRSLSLSFHLALFLAHRLAARASSISPIPHISSFQHGAPPTCLYRASNIPTAGLPMLHRGLGGFGRLGPKGGQRCPELRQKWAKVGFGGGAAFDRSCPSSSKLGRDWSISSPIRPDSANFGLSWSNLGQGWLKCPQRVTVRPAAGM